MRLVSQEIDAVLKKSVPVNFGLYFNKFLEYHDDFKYEVQRKNRDPLTKISYKPLSGEEAGKEPKNSPLSQFKNLYYQSQNQINLGLRQRHLRQSAFCDAARADGYSVFIFHTRLQTPYISGLGMSHPTETGMVFDHTLGVPYIPAAGQKGLLRLAYMLNELKDENGNWLPFNQLDLDEKGNPCWNKDDLSLTLFGYSNKEKALAGRLVILDAYPLYQPELVEDILNPHYGDYYSSQGKKRGPTEDQSPVPVKFMVLKPGQEFVFRFLLRHSLQKAPASDIDTLSLKIKSAMETALTNEGLGAKTALGYGRFEILSEDYEPEEVKKWVQSEGREQQEREKRRSLKIELKKYPWRPLLRKIKKIDNWGEFELKVVNSKWGRIFDELNLNDGKIDSFHKEKEFAEGIRKKALQLAEKNLKKWTEERDKQITDLLAHSQIPWESPLVAAEPEVPQTETPVNALVKTITDLSDWAAYQQAKLKITKLDKPCAEALKKKFSEWRCRNSKNENKKKAFKQLKDRLKKLK